MGRHKKHFQIPRLALFIILLSLISSLFLNVLVLADNSDRDEVTRVIDGDSFELSEGRRVRLISVDAPEKDRCLYSEAKERLTSLILGRKVKLKDLVTDDYGRTLANVYVNDIFVNKSMLMEGLARFTYTGSNYQELKEISQKAKDLKLGIYSPVCRTTSVSENCQIKANNNHGEKFYFKPNCRSYPQVIVDESFGDKWFCSEREARKEGFKKAKNC